METTCIYFTPGLWIFKSLLYAQQLVGGNNKKPHTEDEDGDLKDYPWKVLLMRLPCLLNPLLAYMQNCLLLFRIVLKHNCLMG